MTPTPPQRPLAGIPALIVLREQRFRTIWLASGQAELARRAEQFTLSWFVLQDTDSPFQLGLILVFLFLPRPIFSPIAGIIADRLNRQFALRMMQGVNTLNSLAILLLIATGNLEPRFAFASMVVQGVTWTMEQPIRRTAMFDIVGPGQLVSALALDTFGFTIGRLAGPLIAGALLATMGFREAYIFALVINAASLALFLRARVPQHPPRTRGQPVWTGLVEAARYSLGVPAVLAVVLFTLVMNGLGFPSQQFVPAIGRDHLEVGPALVGLLVAAEACGLLLGSAAMASVRRVPGHGTVLVGGSLIILTMAMTFVWSPWYTLTFLMLAIGGVGQAGYATMQSSIAMLHAPPDLRGRVLGVLGVCIGVSTPLGTLEMGAAATAFSTRWSISLNALAGLLLLVPVVLMVPIISSTSRGSRAGEATP